MRANPGVVDGRPFRGLIGIEWSSETYVKSARPNGGTLGTMKWSRRDVRLLAGAEWSFDSGWGLSPTPEWGIPERMEKALMPNSPAAWPTAPASPACSGSN